VTKNHKLTTRPASGEITDELAVNRSWVDVSVPKIYMPHPSRDGPASAGPSRVLVGAQSGIESRGFPVSAETLAASQLYELATTAESAWGLAVAVQDRRLYACPGDTERLSLTKPAAGTWPEACAAGTAHGAAAVSAGTPRASYPTGSWSRCRRQEGSAQLVES
jgi:hypothetical protein